MKKVLAVLLVAVMSANVTAVLAADDYATRGEVVDMLMIAADDYNDVSKEDIIQGYEDGQLHEERNVTRAEALVMLKRAFGTLPKPTGHNARVAIPMEDFNDIPQWAENELGNVFQAGIVAGVDEGVFAPDENVTTEQMNLFIKRVFSLFGTNEKDDFYATINKEKLDSISIGAGKATNGTFGEMEEIADYEIMEIVREIIAGGPYKKGTTEQKISDFYANVVNMEERNKEGIKPIKKYLDLIDTAKDVSDLIDIQSVLYDEIFVVPFMNFGLSIDMKDSTKYILTFGTTSPSLPKSTFENYTQNQKDSYIKYLTQLFAIGGESEDDALQIAESIFNHEKKISESMLNREEYGDVDKIYNIYTFQQIQDIFKNVDMAKVFESSGLKMEDKIVVDDPNLVKAYAQEFVDENIEVLKNLAKYSVFVGWGGALNQEFVDASLQFQSEFYGIDTNIPLETTGLMTVKNTMTDDLDRLYAEKCFSEDAKKDVEKMVQDILTVYRKRIKDVDWMSDVTKEKALKKLDTMVVKVGYPDKWESELDNVEIKSMKDGGSYFENMISLMAEQKKSLIEEKQGTNVDKTKWGMNSFTVNAMYNATANDITFPAAILQKPLYDINASYEQNLGSIGYSIAHEITHAFDNNGAKFDENGNANNWWTQEDYDAFQKLCEEMVRFYDGQESVPGIPMNGTLTLSENVADQGAVACLTEIVSGLENPDYKTFYESMANSWLLTASREYLEYLAQVDVHSAGKLRVNRVVVNCDEFYNTFDIKEGDGMYVKPEDRVKIW